MIDMLLARSVQRLTRDKQINPAETQDHDLHFPHSSSDLLRRDDSVVHRLGVQVMSRDKLETVLICAFGAMLQAGAVFLMFAFLYLERIRT